MEIAARFDQVMDVCSCNSSAKNAQGTATPKKLVVYSLFGDSDENNIRKRYYEQLEKRVQEITQQLPGDHQF